MGSGDPGALADARAPDGRPAAALARRDAVLAAVAAAAESLLRAGSWEDGIDEALAGLGAAIEASRAYLFQWHEDANGQVVTSQRHEWCAPGIVPLRDSPELQGLPVPSPGKEDWWEAMQSGHPYQTHTRDLPGEARGLLEQRESESFLEVPVSAGGRPWGFIGLDSCAGEREWASAEVEALRAAAARLGHWRVEATLVVTQEPCPMCAGAIVNARVKRLVYGCPNPKAGAVATLYQLCTDPRLNHRVEVLGPVRAEECAAQLKRFFEALRLAGEK